MGLLSRNNRLIPAGNLDNGNGRFSIKVPSVIENASDLYDLPLISANDAVVTLSDVADIQRTFKTRSGYSRMNGRRAITLQITKRTDANVIDTVAEVKQLINNAKPTFPQGVDVLYSVDQSILRSSKWMSCREYRNGALSGHDRSGCRTRITIWSDRWSRDSRQLALCHHYFVRHRFTYNFMVMFGLLLGLGMLIDGAIVVTEEADRRMLAGSPRQAAYSGAAMRMFWPVTASVATT